MMRPLLTLKLSPTEGTRPSSYRSRDGIHPSPRYAAEYSAALWEDVLNSTLVSGSSETKVSAREMLEQRCHDPNILYSPGNYTLDTYKDSLQMDSPLLVCINKVKHKDPQLFSTAEEMKKHWLPCLNITLVAQGSQVFKQRGRGKELARVGGSKASPLAGTSPSGHTDAPCTSLRTVVYTTKVDKCVMSDVEMTDDIELEID